MTALEIPQQKSLSFHEKRSKRAEQFKNSHVGRQFFRSSTVFVSFGASLIFYRVFWRWLQGPFAGKVGVLASVCSKQKKRGSNSVCDHVTSIYSPPCWRTILAAPSGSKNGFSVV